jgi:hypothetical protein
MKYLTLALLLLTSCSNSPKFKVGECFQYRPDDHEAWEHVDYLIRRVEEVGKRKYRVSSFDNYTGTWEPEMTSTTTFTFTMIDNGDFKKVPCPKEKK